MSLHYFNKKWSFRGASVLGLVALATLAVTPIALVPTATYAQNATTGALTGVVSDPTGAVVPGATVTITDTGTGAQETTTTNGAGRYTFPLLKPSTYTVESSMAGLKSGKTSVPVLVGQQATADLRATPSGSSQTVEVSAQTGQLTDTQTPALITTLNEQQVQNLPAPGGDITTVAFTAPGVVLNSGGSYGNFSSDGLPGISNLFVLNGFDNVDPFLNLNNSGSSNLSLGQGEVSEAAVVQNGYSVQYGRGAGAIVNYTTKSGTNRFHGSANYFYNGSILNANDWFRNQEGLGRPKAVSNQWAANAGGPIFKDKLFFFADYEGLRYVLPASGYVAFPTVPFENAVLANIPASLQGFYRQAFALYNSSPNVARAVPVTNGNSPLQDSTGTLGCGSEATLGPTGTGLPDGAGGTFGTTSPCTSSTIGTSSNINKEWLLTGRLDWNINDHHKIFGRYKMDRGSQPTFTNYINPIFNTVSIQPEYEGQLNDTYVFNPRTTNQFIFAANWYTAYFGPADLSTTLAAFPTNIGAISDGGSNGSAASGGPGLPGGTMPLGMPYFFPQGRNVTQYQFVDDLSVIKGSHTFRLGFNFRRDLISDYDAQLAEAGIYQTFMGDFASGNLGTTGNGSYFFQQLTTNKTAYLALYNVGIYFQDEFQASPRLKLTAGIRFDRTGNPLCNNNCFSLYNGTFPQSGVTDATPYNKLVSANQPHPFYNVQSVNPQVRLGFNYDLTGDGHTVVRGGFGMFTDLYPGGILDGFIQNLPNLYAAFITSGGIGTAGTGGTAAALSQASFNAVETGFHQGASSSSLNNTVPGGFAVPNFVTSANTFKNPTYLEYNLQVQRQVSRSDAVILSYVGNWGYNGIVQNKGVNAFAPTSVAPAGFGGLPTAPPDPNFLSVNNYYNGALSNYNGASVTYKHIDNHGLTLDLTYTFSKTLDDVSNGGSGEQFNNAGYNANSIYQIDPFNLRRLNYSLADYDIRHSLVLDWVYQLPFKFQHGFETALLGGWLFAGKSYYRGGTPFTAYNGAAASANTLGSAGGGVLVDFLNPGINRHCGASAATTPCFTASDFTAFGSQTDFGNRPRNQFIGPHYVDTDLNLSKRIFSHESTSLQIGAMGSNMFNHPNFSLPAGDISNTGGLGLITSIAAPPTSPYGSFQGAGVGGRVLQVYGKFNF